VGTLAAEIRRSSVARRRHDDVSGAILAHLPSDGGSKGDQIVAALTTFAQQSEAGTLLPSERVLAEVLNVARMTVRGAIDELEDKGFARRVPGRGTFVAHPQLTHSEMFRSFSEDMRLRGMVPGASAYRATVRKASRAVAAALHIEPGSQVVHIERVRTADGAPMALERTNVPASLFPGLQARMDPGQSLYELIQTVYGIRLESALQRVSISSLTAREAALLEAEEGAPAFLVERTALDNMGRVIEFGRSLYRADRYVIEMHVNKSSGA
jgi:GntR family transcriptional regulator